MTFSFTMRRRGRSLMIRELDMHTATFVYFRWSKFRHDNRSSISLESTDCDGIQLRVYRDGKTQGWRLRGPIQHFESSY